MKNRIRNYGFIAPFITEDQYVLGDFRIGAVEEVLEADQDWGEWDFIYDIQNKGYETFNCFPFYTNILMEDLSYKRISEIKKGEYVISHKGIPRKVTNIFKREYKNDFIQIKVKGLFEPIICTLEHPILTDDGWKKAKEITKENLVFIPTTSSYYKDATIYSVEKNKDFLWLLGLYLAEGNVGWEKEVNNKNPKLKVRGTGNGRGDFHFSVSNEESEITEKIISICDKLFDTKVSIYDRKNSKSRVLTGYNIFLRDLLFELGGAYSDKKKLHSRMMLLEPNLQLEIVKGWLEGDGSLNLKKRSAEGVSVSERLIYQIYRILLRNGVKSTISKVKERKGRKQAYTISFYGENLNKPFNLSLEKISLIDYKEKIKDDFLFKKISEIKIVKLQSKIVYNIEVEEDNSYIAENVAVHNCTGFNIAQSISKIIYRKYGIKFKPSPRWIGIIAGTNAEKGGNDPHTVAEAIRKNGLIPDEMLPFSDDLQNAKEYYSFKGADENRCREEAKKWLEQFEFKHDWVVTSGNTLPEILNNMKVALKYSPLGMAVYAWAQNAQGLYERLGMDTHWTECRAFKGDNALVDDSYEPFEKELTPDFNFIFVKRYIVNKKQPITEERTKTILTVLWELIKKGLTSIFPSFLENYNTVPPRILPETPKTPITEENLTNQEKLHILVKSWLGKDASPEDFADDVFGCAESVSNIINTIYPKFPKGMVSTAQLANTLDDSKDFIRITEPEIGCVICSPRTPTINGHAGFFTDNLMIISNDSQTGKMQTNYSYNEWIQEFKVKRGLKVLIWKPL